MGRYVSACRPFPCPSDIEPSPHRGRFPHALKIHCSDEQQLRHMVAVRPLLRLARSNLRKDERTIPGHRLDASSNAADWMITDPEELLLNSNYCRSWLCGLALSRSSVD